MIKSPDKVPNITNAEVVLYKRWIKYDSLFGRPGIKKVMIYMENKKNREYLWKRSKDD